MSFHMTKEEIIRATSLLDAEDAVLFAQVQSGRWALVSARGLYGVFPTKASAIENVVNNHCQERRFCKSRRKAPGIYSLSILDCDEDPAERFYHDYTLERITPDNILQIQELSLVNLLPEWFFDPYSEEYQTYHTVQPD